MGDVEKGCAILGSVEGRNWEILGLIHFSVFIVGIGFMLPHDSSYVV
jgi:hypothetical protein